MICLMSLIGNRSINWDICKKFYGILLNLKLHRLIMFKSINKIFKLMNFKQNKYCKNCCKNIKIFRKTSDFENQIRMQFELINSGIN